MKRLFSFRGDKKTSNDFGLFQLPNEHHMSVLDLCISEYHPYTYTKVSVAVWYGDPMFG